MAADPQRVVVCSGFAQGTALVRRALGRRGARRVALEDPYHPGQRAIVAASGLEPVPVPVDDQGIQVDRLEAVGADAVLGTPAHQFPTGVVLAPERRGALVEWAQRNHAVIVEDDYDAVTAANLPDGTMLAAMLDDIPAVRTPLGWRHRRPGKLDADKGYDSAGNRAWLRRRGISARIARRGIESSSRLVRWPRTFAGLAAAFALRSEPDDPVDVDAHRPRRRACPRLRAARRGSRRAAG